jgi:hypothetical protein
MARYYFIVEDDCRIDDQVGTVLADDQAARDHALRIIAELTADASFADYHGDMIVIRDGTEVFRISFLSAPEGQEY